MDMKKVSAQFLNICDFSKLDHVIVLTSISP